MEKIKNIYTEKKNLFWLIGGAVLITALLFLVYYVKKNKTSEEEYVRIPYLNSIEENLAVKLERFNDHYIFLKGEKRFLLVDTGIATFRTILANADETSSVIAFILNGIGKAFQTVEFFTYMAGNRRNIRSAGLCHHACSNSCIFNRNNLYPRHTF